MVERNRFESMKLDQLREVAIIKGILGASKLSKGDIQHFLQRLRELEAFPRNKLLDSLKEYQVTGIRRMTKNHLALLVLQTERFQETKVADLRTSARKIDLKDIGRMRKKEIVKQLLSSYAESLRSEALDAKPRLPLPKQLRVGAGIPWKKWLGRAVQLASAVNILFCLVSLVLVPILGSRVSTFLDRAVLTASQEVEMAAVSLRQVNLILDEGVQTLHAAGVSIRNLESSLEDTQPLISSTSDLLTDHTPKAIEDTREALLAVHEGAQAVDQVLQSLAKLGFITGVSYDPEQPLDEGISQVADSLEPLPDALREVGEELTQAGESLEDVGTSLENMGEELEDFADEISSKNFVLANLAKDLDTLSVNLEHARNRIGPGVLMVVVIVEILIFGYALGQAAIFYVGRDLARKGFYNRKNI
jgi:hypothetical protein